MIGKVTPPEGAVPRPLSSARRWAPGSTFLSPGESWPELTALALRDLQVLHSRLSRQRDWEYVTADGPHPLTLDRLNEVTALLDDRDGPHPRSGSTTRPQRS